MKKHGMINRDIAASLAAFGHTDLLVIGDCGLPIPSGVTCVDLSYQIGKPSFMDIFKAVLEDFEAESISIAEEIREGNPDMEQEIRQLVQTEYISHEELKSLSRKARLIIRTGEATPYANAVLRSGVIF